MIVEKIHGTESYMVRNSERDVSFWLVREINTEHPTVISVQDRRGHRADVYLKSDSRVAKKVIAAVKRPSVQDAVKAWHEVSSKYAEFGASDTEPRAEFSVLMDSVESYLEWGSEIRPVPNSARKWQLYGDMKGSAEAARELTKAARVAVDAAKHASRAELLRAIGY